MFLSGGARTSLAAEPPHRIAELDAFWKEISRTVREGDFEGYRATCHEDSIFLYSTIDAEGRRKDSHVHFEVLLVKKEAWKILMEYQKSAATPTEWEQIGKAETAER